MTLAGFRRSVGLRLAAVALVAMQVGCGESVTAPRPAAQVTLRVTSPVGSHEARGSYDDLLAPLFALARDSFVADGRETQDPLALGEAEAVEVAGPGGTRLALRREGDALVGDDGTRIELDVAAGRAELRRGAIWYRVELAGLDAENSGRSLGLLALQFASGRPIAALAAREGKLLGLILAIAGVLITVWVAYHTYSSLSECRANIDADASAGLREAAACALEDEDLDGVWVCYAAACECGFWCAIGINDVNQGIVQGTGDTEQECHDNVTGAYPEHTYYGAAHFTRADLAQNGLVVGCPKAMPDLVE